MSLLDKYRDYKKAKQERRVERAATLIKNSKAIKEDRQAAIQFLGDLGDPAVAVPALLQRFEYSLEHGINDTREKEAVMEAIQGYGPQALPLVKDHLIHSTRIAWPIKVLKVLGDEHQVVEVLKSALDFGDTTFDQARVDKNYDILCYLGDYKIPGFAPKLAPFLDNPDERVRFACVELLIEQDDPEVPELLERFLSDDTSENLRLRQSTIQAFKERGWVVKDRQKFQNNHVAGNVFINQNGKLEARLS